MKLQTALSSWATGQNKSCPGYPWYPAVGFFDSSGSVLGDLSYLTKSHQHETKTQNGIYPRPSGQTVGLHYFFIGSSKSCSTIMRGWTKSKQHIQHTQTHTSLQICTSKKKRLPKWEVFHQHLIFLHFPPCFRTKTTYLDLDPGKDMATDHFSASWIPSLFQSLLLIWSYRFFPWELNPSKKQPSLEKLIFCSFWRKEDLFLKSLGSQNHKSCEEWKKSSWKFCFFKSCMRS